MPVRGEEVRGREDVNRISVCAAFLAAFVLSCGGGGGGGGNGPPTAHDQSVNTPEDASVSITLTASDPDGDALTWTIDAQPAHGTLSGAAPALTYTPDADYAGADSFTFHVNDGQLDSNVATVSISVGGVWYVDIDAIGAEDGTSWADAFRHPQDGVDAAWAAGGGEVWVAEGTYVRKGSSYTSVLTMLEGVAVYGGFAGTEASLLERDSEVHVTTLDGDEDWDQQGDVSHVVLGASNATLDGLTITHGNADGSISSYGGGFRAQDVNNLVVSNCIFDRNYADHTAGAMDLVQSTVDIEDCVFSNNSTPHSAGAVRCYMSTVNITGCQFIGNEARGGGSGGAISIFIGTVTITDCVFEANFCADGGAISGSGPFQVSNCLFLGNTAGTDGGGIDCHAGSDARIRDCIFDGNSANNGGGIAAYQRSKPRVLDCTFIDNRAVIGGAIYSNNSDPEFERCTFTGNSADTGGVLNSWSGTLSFTNCRLCGNTANLGGAVCGLSSTLSLTNCTLSANSASEAGGAVRNKSGSFYLTNCILWGDTAPSGPETSYEGTIGGTTIVYSDVDMKDALALPYEGEGNINENPIFVAPGHWDDNGTPADDSDDFWVDGDYRLQASSPCIDAGTSEGAPGTDIEGTPRPQGSGYDMGAYEQ